MIFGEGNAIHITLMRCETGDQIAIALHKRKTAIPRSGGEQCSILRSGECCNWCVMQFFEDARLRKVGALPESELPILSRSRKAALWQSYDRIHRALMPTQNSLRAGAFNHS